MLKVPQPDLVIAGASTRAAAMSALRAGFRSIAFDRFGDVDLRRLCGAMAIRAEDYPENLPGLIDRHAPPGTPLVYTGALEHYPQTLRQISAHRPVWGNPGPFDLQHAMACGLAEVLAPLNWRLPRIASCPAAEGRWLWKPVRSGGGRGIRWLQPGQPAEPSGLVQEWIEGESFSAVALADTEQAVLVGLNRQAVGVPWLHAAEFSYCGSVGPICLPAPDAGAFHQALAQIARAGNLRGLFGVDLIHDAHGWWLIEVNPRLTASVEVHELALREPLMHWHVRCFQERTPLADWPRRAALQSVAKAVYFVPRNLVPCRTFPRGEFLAADWSPWQVPPWADVPEAGSPLVAGQPLLTLLAAGPLGSEDDLWDSLRNRVQALEKEMLQ